MAVGGARPAVFVVGIGEVYPRATLDIIDAIAVFGGVVDRHAVGSSVIMAVGAHQGGIGMGTVVDIGFRAESAPFRGIFGAFRRSDFLQLCR